MSAITEDQPFEGYIEFHERCEALTGDGWCPYPSERFAQAVIKATDDVARELINRRRQFSFPSFLGGEPMEQEINQVLNERR